MTEHPTRILPWTVDGSRHVFRDRWISVRADHCHTPEGVEIAPFYVLEYPDWVVVVALDEEDHLLLVEQYRHGLGIASLELPAGGIDPGDAGPLGAAARELVEETGYEAKSWQHVIALAPNPASHNNRCHVLLAQGARNTCVSPLDPSERLSVVRLPVMEAVELARTGGIVQAMHVAALALALGRVGRW